MNLNIDSLAWQKMNGLIPAIIQHHDSHEVLMLGYMNREALLHTLESGNVTFYSRSKKRIWTKGETTRHFLRLRKIYPDCDNDALIIMALPCGPTCHSGMSSCFAVPLSLQNVMFDLEALIRQRQIQKPKGSYIVDLLNSGNTRIAQKVGEEGVEVALAAVLNDKKMLCEEAADLLFHLLVLLCENKSSLTEVLEVLQRRALSKNLPVAAGE